ncbi:MAG: hypothetical protein HZA54_06475 [Planctomycetes bacterium]|nr:hypothetical protein [Planctomycetota bacterium]
MNWLSRLWKDQHAQGMAECVILAPVYVVLTYGIMMFGEMGVLRKKCMEGARFAACNDVGESEVKDKFFENVSHEVTVSSGSNSEVKVEYKPVEVVRYFAHYLYWQQGSETLAETLEIKDSHNCKK